LIFFSFALGVNENATILFVVVSVHHYFRLVHFSRKSEKGPIDHFIFSKIM